jgi:transcriptional regulator with XRE-family HTH domain
VSYGERIRDLRAERRLSLRDVVERGGPNKDTMSLIERGVHEPRALTLARIAEAFDMSVAELRYELEARPKVVPEDPPDSLSQLLEQLGSRTRHLTDENLGDTLADLPYGEVIRIAREVRVEIDAVAPVLTSWLDELPKYGEKWRRAAGLAHAAYTRSLIARLSLAARSGETFVADDEADDAEREAARRVQRRLEEASAKLAGVGSA